MGMPGYGIVQNLVIPFRIRLTRYLTQSNHDLLPAHPDQYPHTQDVSHHSYRCTQTTAPEPTPGEPRRPIDVLASLEQNPYHQWECPAETNGVKEGKCRLRGDKGVGKNCRWRP